MVQGWNWRRAGQQLMATALGAVALVSYAPVQAAPPIDQWRWFEVEVLVFRHNDAGTSDEQFPWQGPRNDLQFQYDLISPELTTDFTAVVAELPECEAPALRPDFSVATIFCRKPYELDPALPFNQQRQQQALALEDRLPRTVFDGQAQEVGSATAPFLAPAEQLELAEMRQQLVRRGTATPLLHLSWYQPVFSQNDAYKIRLFGGENYGKTFSPEGYLYQDASAEDSFTSAALVHRIEQMLAAQQQGQLHFTGRAHDRPIAPPPASVTRPNQPTPVWELDGTLQIYLVGNYLHIASDLELREPHAVNWQPASLATQAETTLAPHDANLFLRSFKLEQLRRVISHETHYFDHPKLGVVVQIRRTGLSARRY